MFAASKTDSATASYEISRSLRFNSVDASILTRTVASGNRRTWTWSGWVKKSTIDTGNTTNLPFLFASTDMATGSAYLQFGSYGDESALNCLSFQDQAGGAYVATTVAKFRDVSAWYHIVCVFDTTQSVSTDRLKLYVIIHCVIKWSVFRCRSVKTRQYTCGCIHRVCPNYCSCGTLPSTSRC